MPRFWMVTNRTVGSTGLRGERGDGLTFWTATDGPLDRLSSWTKVSRERFQTLLTGTANKFALLKDENHNEQQKHVSIFVHGYNNDWQDAARRYASICKALYHGEDGLGWGRDDCTRLAQSKFGEISHTRPLARKQGF